MKNCEEMVGSLLRRRAEYEENRRKQRQTVLRLSTAVCSLALLVFIGAGVNGGWWLAPEPELPTVTPTQMTEEPTAAQPTVPTEAQIQEPTSTEEPVEIVLQPEVVENQIIIINEIADTSNNLMYFALMRDDFIPMTESELQDYYGTEFVPEVPEDLVDLRREPHLGIYRRDGGTGEVYHDEQHLTWTVDEAGSRGINVTVRKNQLPYQFFALLTNEEMETSVIRDVEVGIGRTESGTWLVEFLYKDVGFRMVAEGLSQNELVAVIESLLD